MSIFGQSHSYATGVTIDGLPAGIKLDMTGIKEFLARRRPGQSVLTTARTEDDIPDILSGLLNGYTCGAPLTIMIRNMDVRSDYYRELQDIPRPSHADYTAYIKYGRHHDISGGGHFSGRLTAALCVAGGICKQILKTQGVDIDAQIVQIGKTRGTLEEMMLEVSAAKESGDSVGGVIECTAEGLPAGLGDPMFDGIENRIAGIVFGIPGVKGIEFGSGFAGAALRGSENNDSFYVDGEQIKTRTNNCGGILGGITNGMPVVFRTAFKPTPSIGIKQDSISLSRMENTVLEVKGRHDPCIVLRAVPCVEAAAAFALYDAFLDH